MGHLFSPLGGTRGLRPEIQTNPVLVLGTQTFVTVSGAPFVPAKSGAGAGESEP